MITIYNKSTDPYFNLAAEQYLLENTEGDIFMLWRNGPSVIIGKNQNTWAEIDVDFCETNGIKVARRITGGGAVFHDLGNVNFTFITDADGETKLNFHRFTEPIIKALGKMGLEAALDGRNDITVGEYKISGNAQCVVGNRLLHHGTLLFSASLSALAGALRVSEKKLKSKGIKSVKSRVKNITELEGYTGERDVEAFIDALFAEMGSKPSELFDTDKIEALATGKFRTWDWNYGVSPDFDIERECRFSFGTVSASFNCHGGVFEKIKICGDFFGTEDISVLEETLCGVRYDREAVMSALEGETVSRCIMGSSPEDICKLVFGEKE